MIVNQVLSNPQFWLFISALTALIVAVTAKIQVTTNTAKVDQHTVQLNGGLETKTATMIVAAMGLAQSGHIPTVNDLTGNHVAPTLPPVKSSVIPPVNVPPQVAQQGET